MAEQARRQPAAQTNDERAKRATADARQPVPTKSGASPPTPLTPAAFATAIANFFAPQGQLAATKAGFEPRPGQQALAQAIGSALLEQRALLAEAGTGTGKTLAYLVPALLSRLKVVVSTATKQLQEQILQADVPAIARALGRTVDVVVLKGRQNYLCVLHYDRAIGELARDPQHAGLVPALQQWRASTETGERSAFAELADDARLWQQLTATREQCLGRSCRFYESCFVVRARRRAQEADLVVVNHHLFFADVALGQRGGQVRTFGLLPPFEAAIFDEAHELDDIAGQHFGHGITDQQLLSLLGEVERRAEQASTLPDMEPIGERARASVQALFATLPTGGRQLLHVGTPEALAARDRAHAQLDDALHYLEAELSAHSDEESRQLGGRVGDAARRLATVLDRPARAGLLQEAEGWADFETAPTAPATAGRQAAAAEQAATDADDRRIVLDEAPNEGGQASTNAAAFVRFSEVTGQTRALAARPVDVTATMGALFAELPAVFLSATLQVAGRFDHVRQRLGLGADVTTLAQDSPFLFTKQATLYVADDLPEPERDPGGVHMARRAAELVAASGGGALLLCTSHRATLAMQNALRGKVPGPLLVQGQAPKAHLLAQFASRTDATLVATLGFWRGVDVPGAALRLVVMDRIPFAVPTDPLVQAKMAAMLQQGRDPFAGYQLPQAALLLRQGFGRLIRRRQDQGVVALLDRRVLSRGYGAELLASLPACPRLTSFVEVQAVLAAQRAALGVE